MTKFLYPFLLALFLLPSWAQAQISGITITPAGATGDQNITITLDPSLVCPGLTPGLGAVTKVRLHGGVTLAGQNWQQVVQAGPGANNTLVGFTRQANGKWTKTINPRTYFSVPVGTPIEKLCFVLNGGPDGNNWANEGKNDDNGSCGDFIIPFPLAGPIVGCTPLVGSRAVTHVGNLGLCFNDSVTLIAPQAAGNSYAWLQNGARISGKTGPQLRVADSGRYSVFIQNGNACGRSDTARVAQFGYIQLPSARWDNICGSGTSRVVGLYAPQGGTYGWYSSLASQTPLAVDSVFTTPVIRDSTTYYVQAQIGQCHGRRISFLVEVRRLPPLPSVRDTAVCGNSAVTLTARPPLVNDGVRWYTDSTTTTFVGIDNSYTTPVISAFTKYFVTTMRNGCESSPRTPVRINIAPPPSAPGTYDTIRCGPGSVILRASVPAQLASSVRWYADSVSTTSLGAGEFFTTPTFTQTRSYFAGVVLGSCVSPRTRVTIQVRPQPGVPISVGADRCGPGPAYIVATHDANSILTWYDALTGGNSLGQSDTLRFPNLTASTTVYASATSNNACESPRRAAVIINVNTPPVPPAITRVGNILQSNYATGNQWFNTSTGIVAGANRVTYTPTANGTYYVEYTDANGCTSRSPDYVFVIIGIADDLALQTTVYPNPTQGTFTLQGVPAQSTVRVYNSVGALVLSGSAQQNSFTLPAHAAGLYWVEVSTNNQTQRMKLVVE